MKNGVLSLVHGLRSFSCTVLGGSLIAFLLFAPQSAVAQGKDVNSSVYYSPVTGQEIRVTVKYSNEDFLQYTNQIRVARGLKPLTINSQLGEAATLKAKDMVVHGYWDHFRPDDQKAPWDFIEESGYDYKVAGENLARGFITPAGITEAWQKSPSHLANLVSPKYTEVGFSCLDVNGVLYTVQMFGSK